MAESDHTGLVTTGSVTVRSSARRYRGGLAVLRAEKSRRDGRGAGAQTPIRCGCGPVHTDPSVLAKVGWQADGHGGAALLVNCECRSTLVAERMDDACLCATCRRLVTGTDGDVKVCAWDAEEGPLVLCAPCFPRPPRRGPC